MHLRAWQQPRFLWPWPPRNGRYQTKTHTPPLARLVFRTSVLALAGPARLGTPLMVQNFTQVVWMNLEDCDMFSERNNSFYQRVSPVVIDSQISPIRACHLFGLVSVTASATPMARRKTTHEETPHSRRERGSTSNQVCTLTSVHCLKTKKSSLLMWRPAGYTKDRKTTIFGICTVQ